MNLFQALTKIENSADNKFTALDVRDYIGRICKSLIINIDNNYFLINTSTLTDEILLQALYNDMCNNSSRYKDELVFISLLEKIDVNLYRLQKISRI